MLPIRIKACSESDLRMLGNLARNIQRVLPVTQADIDAAAALGQGWVVWKVIEVTDPIDNLRGGTQLVIKENSITPGKNIRRVLIVSGPGGETVVIGPDESPLLLPDAIADSLTYVKAYGGTEQRNLPDNYIERQFIYMMDGSYLLTDIVPTFAGHYELEMQTTSVTTNATTYLGSRDESSGNGGLRFAHISDKTFRILGFGNAFTSSGTATNNTKYKFIWDNGSFWVYSGTTLIHSGTFTEGTMPTTTPLTINGWNSGGTIGGNIEGIYLYSFKAWNGQGELVMNLVPAVQKGTVPVVGFYDTVSGTFKTATAGTFAAGGEAVPSPDTPMDIVCNNGVLKYGNVSKNLFDEDYGEIASSFVYKPLYLGPGTYTCSYSLPAQSGNTSMIYFLNDSVSAGASNGVNQVDASTPRTITTSTGYVTLAYRKGDAINLPGKVPSDYDCMIEKGSTATPYEPYRLAVYTDGTTETLWVHSKNLFDENWNRNTGVSTQTATWGQVVSAPSWSTSGLIPVTAGRQYTVSYNTTVQIYIFYYESDGTMQQSYDTTSGTKKTFTVPAGATHIRLQVNKSTEAAIADLEAQLETGATATTYAQYYDGGTATCEDLLSVGDYTDVQEVIAGDVTRKVGVLVLDGTEDWSIHTSGAMKINVSHPLQIQTIYGVCTHFEGVPASVTAANMTIGQFKLASTTNEMFFKTSYDNTTSWKNWLADQYAAGTPVIIVYPLATSTTESVAGQTLQVQAGDNTLEITQASIDDLEIEAEYQKA